MKTRRILRIRNISPLKFKIVEQSHRGKMFAKSGDTFRDSSGFVLVSMYVPDVLYCFFVRGSNASRDHTVLRARSHSHMLRIRAAIREYNKTNGGYE